MSDNPIASIMNTPEALAQVAELRKSTEAEGELYSLKGEELRRVHAFENEHDAKHGLYSGAIGGRYTYSFTPTSIGTAVAVSCSCGEKLNATDFEDW